MAERQTLLNFLPLGIANRWIPRIRLGIRDLFERKWTFVEEAVVVDNCLTFRFNPNTRTPGPFTVTLIYQEEGSDKAKEKSIVV